MNEDMRMWTEISFNVAYLLVVWGLVITMLRRRANVRPAERPVGELFIRAFALLAVGDTGHVGFRVLAYALGDLETTFTLFGVKFGLVGLGALSTAITVTFFYVLMLVIWQRRFNGDYGWLGLLLFIAAAARLAIMLLPQNQWNKTVPPQPWSFYRNLPLMVQGLGVAVLILRDADTVQDRVFKWVGVMILVSFTFYAPVIFFVQTVPAVGMLMIPKTLAYVAIAWLAFRRFYRAPATERLTAAPQI